MANQVIETVIYLTLVVFLIALRDWATVGTDGQMKMWKLDFKKDSLTLKHTKTLQLKESILGIEFTRDKKFIAVALIDSTVKVFYRDTLKFWNSMYGHRYIFEIIFEEIKKI
jgi:U3 small nucleolar RNA-associated protein 12